MTAIKAQPTESVAMRRYAGANATGPVPIVTSKSRWAKDAHTTGQVAVIKSNSAR